MGRIIVVILLLLGNCALAQNTNFKKAEKHYQKGNYDKCISTTLKLKKKYPKTAEPYYYLSIAYFKKYKFEQKKYLFTKSLNYIKLGRKKDKTLFYQDDRIGKIHQELKGVANQKKEKNNKRIHNQLAQLFNDTTTQYYVLNKLIGKDVVELKDTIPSNKINREYMLAVAENLIGVPYKYGGEDKKGFDCSGFVKYVYKQVGVKLPHNAHMMSKLGSIVSREEARLGDLVVFGYRSGDTYRASHAGMVYRTGEDFTVIHCVSGGVNVANNDWANHWESRVLFIKKIIQDN